MKAVPHATGLAGCLASLTLALTGLGCVYEVTTRYKGLVEQDTIPHAGIALAIWRMDVCSRPTGVVLIATNTNDEPLVVNKVVLNGEHEADLALPDDDWYMPDEKAAGRLPVTLTIGDSAAFWLHRQGDEQAYQKQVVFIDFHTNKGALRYRPRRWAKQALKLP